jgi:hypothetical protein
VAFLFLIGGGFVVEDCIPVEANAVFFCQGGEGEEFFLGAPFGCYTTLLIEFAEVVEIVDVVAVALGRGVSMVRSLEGVVGDSR